MTASGDHAPSVHLHIERLVLDGLPFPPAELPRLQAGIEEALARALADPRNGGWSDAAPAGRRVGSVVIDPAAGPAASGRRLGDAIAEAVIPFPGAKSAAFPTAK